MKQSADPERGGEDTVASGADMQNFCRIDGQQGDGPAKDNAEHIQRHRPERYLVLAQKDQAVTNCGRRDPARVRPAYCGLSRESVKKAVAIKHA